MRCLTVLLVFLLVTPATAQVISRPTDPPIVTAENDSWYRLGEPIIFAGDVYYRAGAAVFFNGNTMVRTGHYNGVPLYADTTIEPYSIVYVPIGRGLLQPYERRRQGALAGTAGSRTPSFPAERVAPGGAVIPNAPIAPTGLPQPIGAISAFTPEAGAVGTTGVVPRGATDVTRTMPVQSESLAVVANRPVGTGGVAATTRPSTGGLISVVPPDSNDGIWVPYRGQKWVSAGPVVPLTAAEFELSGDYAGFPVYTRSGQPDVIYLPSTPNQVAPYRLKR